MNIGLMMGASDEAEKLMEDGHTRRSLGMSVAVRAATISASHQVRGVGDLQQKCRGMQQR
jgi:hypothetical protein